jgi:CheY-like chemotaxis protein
MVSATIEQGEVEKAIRLGVSEYLVKPFSRKLLKERIISAIQTPIRSNFNLESPPPLYDEETNVKEEKLSVLIADDVVDNIKLISDTLKGSYIIQAAKSGHKALQICTSNKQPDIVLLDIKMPVMDGLEVCERLKNNPATQHITVIFITALGQTEDIVKGLELGAIDYITKPINPPVIKARLKNHANLVKANNNLKYQLDTLIENIRLRDEFDRILQNDLNSPLEEMLESIQLADKYNYRAEQVKFSVRALKQSHTQLSQHINNMISLYKIEDGNYNFIPKAINLKEIVSEVVDAFTPTIRNKNLEINFSEQKNFWIKAEHILTSSLFSNIFVNLMEEAPRGSVIKITLAQKSDHTQLTIHNQANIANDIKAQFFNKYIHYGRKGALGIGNYAAKLMIEIQKGSISLESDDSTGTSIKLNFVTHPRAVKHN